MMPLTIFPCESCGHGTHLLPIFLVRVSIIAIQHLQVANLQACSNLKPSDCLAVLVSLQRAASAASPCLELLMRFANSLAVPLLSPVVTVLSEEANCLPIEQEDRPSCSSTCKLLEVKRA